MFAHLCLLVKRLTPDSIPTIATHDCLISMMLLEIYAHDRRRYIVLASGYLGMVSFPGSTYTTFIAHDSHSFVARYAVSPLPRIPTSKNALIIS